MKKYFVYQLKKSLLPMAVIFAFFIIAYVMPIALNDYLYWNTHHNGHVELNLGTVIFILSMMCVIVPVYMLSYRMSKRSADMYYSLPISRTKILFVHYVVGFITVIAAYTLSYWLGFAIVAARVKYLALIWYLWLYLATIIPAFIIYAITAFAFTRGNTMADGVIFIILTHFAIAMIILAVQSVLSAISYGLERCLEMDGYLFVRALSLPNEYLARNIYTSQVGWSFSGDRYTIISSANELAGSLLSLVLAVAATTGLFLTEKRSKAENCGQISESVFGYKLMIPLYTITAMGALTQPLSWYPEYNLIIWAAIAFCAFIMTVIYRRSIKIGKIQGLLLIIYMAAGIAFALAVNADYSSLFPPTDKPTDIPALVPESANILTAL